MPDGSYELAVYLSLARASERRNRLLVRDRMFLLAGIQAAEMQLYRLSQYCRSRILEHNPKHYLSRWESIAQGLCNDEFVGLTQAIRKRYPIERAEQLLSSLGIDISNEQAAYYDVIEYTAAILNLDPILLSDSPGLG